MFPVLSSSDALPSSQRLSSPLSLLSPSRSLSSSQSLHPLYSSPLYDSSFNHQPILSPYFPQNAFSQFSPSFSVKQPGVLQSVKFPFQRSQLKPKEGKPADASQPPFLMHLNAQPSYALPSQFPVGAPREPAAPARVRRHPYLFELHPRPTLSHLEKVYCILAANAMRSLRSRRRAKVFCGECGNYAPYFIDIRPHMVIIVLL